MMMMIIIIIIANNNIQYYGKDDQLMDTQLARLWMDKMFSCRSILFIFFVTFSLFMIDLIQMLCTSRDIANSPGAYGQYNNLIM